MRHKKQKGFSILLTILIMAALLVVAVSVSRLSVGEMKLSRDIEKSLIAYYAADAGIEAAIYYERSVLGGIGGTEDNPITEEDAMNVGALDISDICLDYPENNICFTFKIYVDETPDPDMRFLKSNGSYKDIQRAIELTYELN